MQNLILAFAITEVSNYGTPLASKLFSLDLKVVQNFKGMSL
jgi:hypothetical protein